MIPRPTIDDSQELDRFVAALEEAYRHTEHVNLATLVPHADHPLYDDIVRELVRVDIELRAGRSDRLDLNFYQSQFPTLFTRRDDLEAVAYEDYRQRQLAGEHPQPEEYARRWHIDISGWPTNEPAARSVTDSSSGIVQPGQSLIDSLATDAGTHRGRPDPNAGPEPPSTELMPRIGDTFLGFELLALLGRGAFAKVYLARQGELADRPVALKITRRTGSEPQTLARLQHTNIVPIYSVHRGGAFQAVCMPYCGGVTLADVVRELRHRQRQPASGRALVETVLAHQQSSPWRDTEVAVSVTSPHDATTPGAVEAKPAANAATALNTLSGLSYIEAVLWIGAQLADGLAHAHERGILHRDLKPANVLLASDGQPMLLDFNLSQDRHTSALGRATHIGGTLPYMAPEMLRAFQLSMPGGDERSDIYSLGLVLYEVLTGEYPFPLRHGELEQVLVEGLADRKAAIPSPRQINPTITPAIEAIVLRCLQYDPARRYATARELQTDLQCQLEHRPLRYSREPSLVERGRKWLRRHPRLASSSGVAALAATVLMVVGGLLVARNAQVARFEAHQQLATLEQSVQQTQIAFLDVVHDQPQAQATLEKLLAANSAAVKHSPRAQFDDDAQERWNLAQTEAQFLQATYALRQAKPSQSPETAVTVDPSTTPAAVLARAQNSSADMTTRELGHQAALLSQERRFADAHDLWERLTHADPQNLWAWYGLGHCSERLGKFDVAAECYSACIALAPQQTQWHFRRGLCHLQRHQHRLASQDFSTVLKLDPQHHEALVNRALSAFALGDTTAALDDLAKAMQHGGDAARVFLLRAQVREHAGDSAGAKHDREQGLVQTPRDEQGWTARGVLRAASEPRTALVDFDHALQLNPSYLPALESKAHVLSEQLDDLPGALQVLDEAIRWHPNQSPTLAASGVLLARRGDAGLAKKRAERALANDSSPSILYQVAGIFALLSTADDDNRERAFSLLTSALRAGFGADLIDRDHDLDPLRGDARFAQLLTAINTLRGPAAQAPAP